MKIRRIIEGISNTDDTITIDFKKDISDDIIKLKLQKFHKRFALRSGKEIYIGYKYNTEDKVRLNLFRDALKGNVLPINEENILVNKAVENFIKINKHKIDVIVTTKTDCRALLNLAKQIHAKYPGSILAENSFIKKAYEDFLIGGQKIDELPEEYKKIILPILKRASKSGEFKMKSVGVKFRKLITNFLEFKNIKHQNIATKIASGNVLVLDDIFTNGSTFQEIFSILDTMGVGNSFGFSLIAAK